MKKNFVKQAKLPKGAYAPDLATILSPFAKKVYKNNIFKHPMNCKCDKCYTYEKIS